MPSATRFLKINEPLTFKRGGSLASYQLAYETWGELNPDASNAVLILTGLSPDAHTASSEADPSEGWWEPMVGVGKPINTDHFFVITVNSLGSCKGSTGPDSENPATGRPYRLDFPELSIEDIAATAAKVVDHFGIKQLCALVGPSMGGMTALAYLLQNRAAARHFLTISSAASAEPFSIAIRSLQRELIIADPAWNDGWYDDDSWPEHGMRMARKLGMLSYRSAEEWRARFGRKTQDYFPTELFGMNFEVESYLEAAARKFVYSFDPCSYLNLSRSMDWFDAQEGYADLTAALAGTTLESAHVIGIKTDILFPVHQQQAIAEALIADGVSTRFEVLPSIMGHDAFLVDYDLFVPKVADCFERLRKKEGL